MPQRWSSTLSTVRASAGRTRGNLPRVISNQAVILFTLADCSRGVEFSAAFVRSVCPSVVPHDISETAAARITKLDVEIFHHESWKVPTYLGSKGQRSRSRVAKKSSSALLFLLHINNNEQQTCKSS